MPTYNCQETAFKFHYKAVFGCRHMKGYLSFPPQGFDYSAVLPGQGHYYNPDFLIDGIKKRIEGLKSFIMISRW